MSIGRFLVGADQLARRLAEAGFSALQVGAITGHKTLKEICRYTAAADQEPLAWDAMENLP